jgi:hypothetical protein
VQSMKFVLFCYLYIKPKNGAYISTTFHIQDRCEQYEKTSGNHSIVFYVFIINDQTKIKYENLKTDIICLFNSSVI